MINIIGISSLSSLNLVAPKSGLVCRLSLKQYTNSTLDEVQQKLNQILLLMGENYDVPTKSILSKCPEETDTAIVYQFCALSILIQKAVKSSSNLIQLSPKNSNGCWDVFVEHETNIVGRLSLRFAVKIVQMITSIDGNAANDGEVAAFIGERFLTLEKSYSDTKLKHEARVILKAAEDRQIPWRRLPGPMPCFQYGYGTHQQPLLGTILGFERHGPVKFADNKATASALLAEAGLPVAYSEGIDTERQAQEFVQRVGFPVVVKPMSGMRGGGVTPNIQNMDQLSRACKKAVKFYPKIRIEKHIEGEDHRLTVFNGKFVGVFRRPNTVMVGDGKSTVGGLIAKENKKPWRNWFGGGPRFQLQKAPVVTDFLKEQGYDWNNVVPAGKNIFLNVVSQGANYQSVSMEEIHPENVKLAERAAKTLGLRIAGIDFLTTDISKPYWETGAVICEVNANPTLAPLSGGSVDRLEEIGRLAFETSCPADQNFALPFIVVLSEDNVGAEKLAAELTAADLLVGHYSKDKTVIGGTVVPASNHKKPSISSVIWNGSVETAIVQENPISIMQHGLEYDICSHLLVEDIPQINGRLSPNVLDLILKTVTYGVIVNRDNPELMAWAENQDQNKIRFAAKGDLQSHMMTELRSAFPDVIRS